MAISTQFGGEVKGKVEIFQAVSPGKYNLTLTSLTIK
jgi:hypothetical protein